MFLVDSHCHLDGLDYESLHKDVDDVLAKAAARDVKFCLAVATTLPGYLHMRDRSSRCSGTRVIFEIKMPADRAGILPLGCTQ